MPAQAAGGQETQHIALLLQLFAKYRSVRGRERTRIVAPALMWRPCAQDIALPVRTRGRGAGRALSALRDAALLRAMEQAQGGGAGAPTDAALAPSAAGKRELALLLPEQRAGLPGRKRQRVAAGAVRTALPDASTSTALRAGSGLPRASVLLRSGGVGAGAGTSAGAELVTLEEVASVQQLGVLIAGRRAQVAAPDRALSLLRSHAFAHLLALRPDPDIVARARHALPFALADGPRGGDAAVLAAATRLCGVLQETPPEVEAHLCALLRCWDGVRCAREVWALLRLLPPRDWDDLLAEVLTPLRRLFLASAPAFQARLLACYTDLAVRWASIDWRHFYAERARAKAAGTGAAGVTAGAATGATWQPLAWDADHMSVLHRLLLHCDQLAAAALAVHADHPLVQHAAARHLREVAALCSHRHLPFVVPPSPALVRRALAPRGSSPLARVSLPPWLTGARLCRCTGCCCLGMLSASRASAACSCGVQARAPRTLLLSDLTPPLPPRADTSRRLSGCAAAWR